MSPRSTKIRDPHSSRARRLAKIDHLSRPMNSIFNPDNETMHLTQHCPFSRPSETKSPVSPDAVPAKEVTNKRKKQTEIIQSRRSQDVLPSPLNEPLLGKNRGIASDWKSSCMNATIFAMFAYNDAFDEILRMKVTDQSTKLQAFLRDYIVSGLRGNEGFVARMLHSF